MKSAQSQLFTALKKNDPVAFQAALDSGANLLDLDWQLSISGGGGADLAAATHGYGELLKIILAHSATQSLGWRGTAALHAAAVNGFAPVVNILLDYGVSVHSVNVSGNSALHRASERGNGLVLDTLLAHGAQVDMCNRLGRTPLMVAAENVRPDALASLLKAGADVNLADNQGWTALHLAARSDQSGAVVGVLLAAGANVEASSTSTRETPLLLAVKHGRRQVVRLLAGAGCRLDPRDVNGRCAEDYSSAPEIAVLLRSRREQIILESVAPSSEPVQDIRAARPRRQI